MTRALPIILIAISLGSVARIETTTAQIGYDQYTQSFCGYGDHNTEVTAPRADAPALVNATLQQYPMLAFRICTDRSGEHYFLRTPEPVVDGVCMFRERDVYPAVDPKTGNTAALASNAPGFVPTWEHAPSPWQTTEPLVDYERDFMAVQQTGCPPLEAQRYIAVQGITAAEFVQLRNTWLSQAKSEDAFASVVADLPRDCDRFVAGFPPAIQKRMYDRLVASLHSFLLDPATSLYVSYINRAGEAYHVHVSDRFDPLQHASFALRIGDVSGTLRVTCLEGLYQP